MTYDAQLMKKNRYRHIFRSRRIKSGGQWRELRFAMLLRLILTQPNLLNLITKEQKVICGDIRDVKATDFLNKDEEVFIIMGGPPCQGFSMSNTMSRNMDNPNNLLFKEFVRLVSEIKPRWFVLENVWGMTKMNNGETIEMIKHCFEEIEPGYKVKWKVLWADEYGVPHKDG